MILVVALWSKWWKSYFYFWIKLGLSYGKVLGTVIGNVDVITLGINVETELGSLDGSFDDYKDGKFEALFLGGWLRSTDGKVLVTISENIYGITLRINVGTDMGSFDISFDGSNDGKVEGLLIGESLGSTVGKVLWFD